MDTIKEYVINTVMKNITENIKLYYNSSDNYFQDIKVEVERIDEDDEYLDYFSENGEPLMRITESTINDIKRLPFIYDLRDGV